MLNLVTGECEFSILRRSRKTTETTTNGPFFSVGNMYLTMQVDDTLPSKWWKACPSKH